MRKLITTLFLAGTLGLLPRPTPADATVALVDCLGEALTACDGLFPNTSDRLLGVRGWCYMIWWGWCEAFD